MGQVRRTVRLLFEMLCDRTGDNRHNLKCEKFYLNIEENFFMVRSVKCWNRLSRMVVESPFSELLGPGQSAVGDLVVSSRVGLNCLQRCFPASAVLFCV